MGEEAPVTPLAGVVRAGANDLTNGNLRVVVDAATGCLTATRVSDGATLLHQTSLVFGQPDVPGAYPIMSTVRVLRFMSAVYVDVSVCF